MGASLIFTILKKGGPYAVILVLGIYAYTIHLKLLTCQADLSMAKMANDAYEKQTKDQDKSIEAAHAAEVRLRKTMAEFQKEVNKSSAREERKLVRFVKNSPKGLDCQSGVIWTMKHSGGL